MTEPILDSPATSAAAPKSKRLTMVLVIALPMIVQAVVVKLFAVNMLIWDEFHYTTLMRQIGTGESWRGWIWHQHNEHRVVWTKLVLLAHASFSGWNPVVEMYVSALMIGVISFGLWKLYRSAGGTAPVLFLPVALLLCSLANYMNMLYGFMTCHYFTLAGMVWSVVFLLRRTLTSVVIASALAFAAMISTLNGIVIWPVGLVVLLLTRQRWPRWLVWIVAMIASALIYFHGYQSPGPHQHVAWSIGRLIQVALGAVTCLGSPLAATSVAWARALGLVTLLAIALTWIAVITLRALEQHAGPIALIVISLGCIAAVAIGRSAVLESKYVLYSTLALIGTYLSLVGLRGHRLRLPALTAFTLLLGTGWLAANLYGLGITRLWRKERLLTRYLLQTADIQPDESLGGVYHTNIRGIAGYLRAANLGPFRQPVDALIAPRWRDGAPTDEIAPSAAVRAEILCPVDTLRDIGLTFSPTPGAPPVGSVHVAVKENGVVLAESVTDASTVRDLTWVFAKLKDPLHNCRGKLLVVDVWSPDAAPGTGLHAWTYPVYYSGVTKHADHVLDQRNLGLAFNAFSAELAP